MRETEWGENFPELAEKGPVSHILLNNFPMHQIMLENFLEALGRGKIREGNVKTVTTKSIYKSRMEDLLTPPKVEFKFSGVNFKELVYPRIRNTVLKALNRRTFCSQ